MMKNIITLYIINEFKFIKKLRYFFIAYLVFTTNVFCALSATTINYILGHPPEIGNTAVMKFENSINFRVTNSLGFTHDYQPNSEGQVYLSLDERFIDISPVIKDVILTDSDISDINGDKISTSIPYTISSLSYTWKDKNDNVISNNSTKNLGSDICVSSTSYQGPYTFSLLFDVAVNTEYGVPNASTMTVQKDFIINADDGICYMQPGTLVVNTRNGWPDGDNAWPAGRESVARQPSYDPDVFVLRKGFKAWVEQKFPTTAFPEARFKIVPHQNINNYTISVKDNPNNALIDQQTYAKGQFKFGNIKPAQGELYTIEVKNNISNISYYYSFALKPSRSWFTVGQVTGNGTSATATARKSYIQAVEKCGVNNLPTRAELTDSIYSTGTLAPTGAYAKNNGFIRGIGPLTSEWGAIYYYAPKTFNDKRDMMKTVNENLKQHFSYWYYWTKDAYSATQNFLVGDVEGNVVNYATSNGDGRILCVE
ncbi:hypothetical protein RHO12_05880 [Orbus sturtevantii]|uniref:hypothetical protein n=1 Tax=Orbus sturtevantii TaxID=3074109 RepID=UPI00370D63DA